MENRQDTAAHEFRLPERRFSGTREEVLQQLDEVIEALVGWRQSLVLSAAREDSAPAGSRRSRRSTLAAKVAAGVLLALGAAIAFV